MTLEIILWICVDFWRQCEGATRTGNGRGRAGDYFKVPKGADVGFGELSMSPFGQAPGAIRAQNVPVRRMIVDAEGGIRASCKCRYTCSLTLV